MFVRAAVFQTSTTSEQRVTRTLTTIQSGGSAMEQKLKKMALKLKKENEGLKASLAKAEEVNLRSRACVCVCLVI